MIWIIINVILLGVMGIGVVLKNVHIYMPFGICGGGLSILLLMIFPEIYIKNLKVQESILMLKNNKQIYLKQANELLPQFKEILGNYGKFEERIYDKITLNNYNVFLANYPELKNIEAVQSLVKSISNYTEKIYAIDIEIEKQKAQLRVDSQNPFIIVKEYKEE